MNSKNYIKMQKFFRFAKRNLKINMLKITKYCEVWDNCHYIGQYRDAAVHSVCNLK